MRTDIHKPSSIQPNDYEFVGFEYIGPEPFVDWIDQQIIHAHQRRTGGHYATHTHGGSCMICGAIAFYMGVFYHAKSSEYIMVGQECSAKMELSTGAHDWSAFKKAARANVEAAAGKQRAFQMLCEKGLQTAWYMWTADCTDVPVDESRTIKDNLGNTAQPILADVLTVRDMVGKVVRYGSLSEKAESFMRILLKRIAERPAVLAARAAEKAAAADCPSGRVTVEGTIVKLAEHESQFGTTMKMTVKATEGFMVWCTVPSGATAEKGSTIKFTVTLTPSDTDKKFGFGKRAVLWMSAAEKKAQKEEYARQQQEWNEKYGVNQK